MIEFNVETEAIGKEPTPIRGNRIWNSYATFKRGCKKTYWKRRRLEKKLDFLSKGWPNSLRRLNFVPGLIWTYVKHFRGF